MDEETSVFQQDSWSQQDPDVQWPANRLPQPTELRRTPAASQTTTPSSPSQAVHEGTPNTSGAPQAPATSSLRTQSPPPNSHLNVAAGSSPPAFQVSPSRPAEAKSSNDTSSATPEAVPGRAKLNVNGGPIGTRKKRGSELDEDEQTFVNEWGFEISEKEKEREEVYIKNVDGGQVLRREVKWSNMTSEWEKTSHDMQEKLKERCRKGIPAKLRGVAWQYLLGSRMEMENAANRGVYAALKAKKLDPEVNGIIERDLGRTFPTHVLFRDQDGVGQTTLRSILHAYANIDPEVGYVQGMGFLVGTLMTQMDEEEAFWALHAMMHNKRYILREMYRPGFPMLQLFFFQLKKLMHMHIPKLHKRFEEIGVDPSFFASQWFLTLFVYHFQFRALLRVWDIFLCEGWKQIFRVAIALMKWEEKELLEMSFDTVLPRLKTLHEQKNPDEILARSLQIKFKTEQLGKWRVEYEAILSSGGHR